MKNILFLCTGNSCRSQMAEGWAKHIWGNKYNFYSAGTEKHGLNPRAVKAMLENGVDISKHFSKTIDDLPNIQFDLVITVCGHANENCPLLPGAPLLLHVGFDDPPKLSIGLSDETVIMDHYHRVCSEIQKFAGTLDSLFVQKYNF